MTIEIKSLRVTAEMDASQYAAGAAQKVAADKAMVASGAQAAAGINQVGNAVVQTDTKISQAGDVLSRLSRQYVDGYASAQRFNSALNQLSTGIERGKITMQQAEGILAGISQKYGLMGDAAQFAARGQTEFATAITNANAKLAAQRNLTPVNQNQGGLARFGSLNATSQFQDIAITSAMGQSPLTIALQQGTQLGMALEQQLGDKGVKGLVSGLGTAFMGLLTPINLVAIGLTAVVAVAVQYGSKILDHSKDIEEALKTHKKLIDDIAAAYPHAGDAAKAYQQEVAHFPQTVLAGDTLEDLRKNQEALRALQMGVRGLRIQVGMGTSEGLTGEAGAVAFTKLGAEMDAGNLSARQLQVEIGKIRIDPDLSNEAHKFADWIQEGANQAAQLEANIKGATAAASQLTGPAGRSDNGQGAAMQAFMVRNASALFEAQRQRAVDLQNIGARSPQERAAAARATAESQPFDPNQSKALRDYEVETAGLKALTEANQQLAEAQEDRRRSLDQTLDSARLDVELIGKTTAETERLRMAFQLEQEVREEAARNHVAVDEAEIARIKQKAAEYGKLRALQEARDTIFNQEQDLELQRAELGAVGQNRIAHDALINSLKTEQEIRRLGIDLYGKEAEAMRANTAEASALSKAIAEASLQKSLQNERDNMFRSPTEQRVASTMQGAGLDYDPESAIAAQIRLNDQLERTKDTWQDIFDVANDGVDSLVDALFDGTKDIDDVLKGIGRDFAKVMFDLAITNPLKNWLTGADTNTIADLGIFGSGASSGKGGGFGGVLGNLLGAQKAVATMQVQAATVMINGGVLGGGGIPGIGSLGAANSNDQLLGAGDTAQKYIQSRIDGAFGTISGGGGADTLLGGLKNGGGSVEAYIRQSAMSHGIDPDIAIRVAKSEGGIGGFIQSNAFKGGIREPSYGPFQLLKGGPGTGFPKGMGNDFQSVTGLNPADPSSQNAGIDFAMERASKQGWGAWYGAKNSGIGRWEGIGAGANTAAPIGKASEALEHLAGTGDMAAESLSKAGLAGFDTVKGLTDAAGGLSKFGSSLASFMAPGGGSGAGWFQGLAGMFGGSGGALSFMQGISPAATASIIGAGGGFTGLFHEGGIAGSATQSRYVSNMGIFRGAPRYHSGTFGAGLAGDEVPAILRRGEPVFKSMEHARQMFAAPANQNIDSIAAAVAKQIVLKPNFVYLADPNRLGDFVKSDDGATIMADDRRRNGGGRTF